MSKVYIALLAHNHYDLTLKRLYELMRHCSESVECVYVINNGSTDETHEGLHWWKSGNTSLRVKEIPIESNLGFLLGANYGLQTVVKDTQPDDMIVLLSNDVLIAGNFINGIREMQNDQKQLMAGKYLYFDTGWNKFGDKLFPYLEGWMLAATAKNWDTLGYFDPRYAPNDYEDVDLSTTALGMGFEFVVVGAGSLFHQGGGTLGYTPERLEQTMKNKQKFEEKWLKRE